MEEPQTKPSEDCISRQAVLNYLESNAEDFPDYHEAIEHILHVPPTTPKQNKGEWKVGAGMLYRCTNCGNGYKDVYEYNFCPNCGADMRGEQNESN